MTKPTIRELLDKIGSFNNGSPSFVLAERVEEVLKLTEELKGYGCDHLLEQIRCALDGEP